MSQSIFTQFRSPYGSYIPKYDARQRWAIGDIHGCAKTLEELIRTIDLRKQDQLYLLGDYINKGPDSLGVLDLMIFLQKKGYNIHPIRGNHEQIFLDFCKLKRKAKKQKKAFNLAQKVLSPELIDHWGDPIPKYFDFIKSLPHYLETEDFFMVHANFNFKSKKPFHKTEPMLNSLDFKVDPKWVGQKVILHGHLPYELDDIQEEVGNRQQIINLDNGCVNALQPEKYRPGIGNLCALNMNSYELVVQRNID